MAQPKMFSAYVNAVGVSAQYQDDGKLHIRSYVDVAGVGRTHLHDTYSVCLDDELQQLLENTLSALFRSASMAALAGHELARRHAGDPAPT
jgi:hypothetical protein